MNKSYISLLFTIIVFFLGQHVSRAEEKGEENISRNELVNLISKDGRQIKAYVTHFYKGGIRFTTKKGFSAKSYKLDFDQFDDVTSSRLKEMMTENENSKFNKLVEDGFFDVTYDDVDQVLTVRDKALKNTTAPIEHERMDKYEFVVLKNGENKPKISLYIYSLNDGLTFIQSLTIKADDTRQDFKLTRLDGYRRKPTSAGRSLTEVTHGVANVGGMKNLFDKCVSSKETTFRTRSSDKGNYDVTLDARLKEHISIMWQAYESVLDDSKKWLDLTKDG